MKKVPVTIHANLAVGSNRTHLEEFGTGVIARVVELIPDAISAHASLEEVGKGYSAAIELRLQGDALLTGHSKAMTPEAAMKAAVGKIEKRLAKLQTARLKPLSLTQS